MHTSKKILGLDLGITSIGWALISESEQVPSHIIDLGSRIIPLSTDDKDEFSKGNAISKNQSRTTKRTQRKGYDRYQLRRQALTHLLKKKDIYPDESLIKLASLDLYGLRDRAVKEKIELKELGRVLYHLNQKRGYKSSRSESSLDKKDTAYVEEVKGRYTKIKEAGITVGQYFFAELQKDPLYRIKQQVFPREAYIEEFDAICRKQKEYHSELTDEIITMLRDEIIYYQRRLKSQKGLVSVCEFEGFYIKGKKGKEIFVGPKVAPRSSPIFQVGKLWETINNITITNKRGTVYIIPTEKKQEIFNYLDHHKLLSFAELLKVLGLKKEDGWYGNKQLSKGLQGNLTKVAIQEQLQGHDELLKFELKINMGAKEVYMYDRKTGEVLGANIEKTIDAGFEQQAFYRALAYYLFY